MTFQEYLSPMMTNHQKRRELLKEQNQTNPQIRSLVDPEKVRHLMSLKRSKKLLCQQKMQNLLVKMSKETLFLQRCLKKVLQIMTLDPEIETKRKCVSFVLKIL